MSESLDRNQQEILEYREKYETFNSYYTSLVEVTSFLSSPLEELPEDIRDPIVSFKRDAEDNYLLYVRGLESLHQSTRTYSRRELNVFEEALPDLLADGKVSKTLADETLNTLSTLVSDYTLNQPVAIDQLPDYIQSSMAFTRDNYCIYKLSLISDLDNLIY